MITCRNLQILNFNWQIIQKIAENEVCKTLHKKAKQIQNIS